MTLESITERSQSRLKFMIELIQTKLDYWDEYSYESDEYQITLILTADFSY